MASSQQQQSRPQSNSSSASSSTTTRGLRHLRSRDSKREVEEAEDDAENSDDMATASHYLNHHRVGAKRKLDYITVQNTPKKRRRVTINGGEETNELQDVYCWECHKECVEGSLDCISCVRCFHPACLPSSSDGRKESSSDNWVCPVCKSEPFHRPVPASLVPDYYDIVFYPMDLSTLEKKVKRQVYKSSEAFLEDAKWIVHNSNIFNGSTSKYTNDAKLIIKICKHEMSELELCPDCFRNSCVRMEDWFAEPCTNPHCLVWAKLKGFPFWPAKALRMSAGNTNNVDVRFFGAHDRAWIPVSQCYLLSEDCPIPMKNMKKHGLDKAMEELNAHVRLLKEKFGEFRFAPFKTEFKPEHLYNCPALFGGAADDSVMRPRPPRSPSSSSVTASSDLSGSQDLESNFREDSIATPSSSKKKSEGKSPAEEASKADSTVNGVFTLDERLDKEVSSGSQTLAETSLDSVEQQRKTDQAKVDMEVESLSCLERIKNSLQAELVANQGNSTGESDVNSEGEEPSGEWAKIGAAIGHNRMKAAGQASVANVRKRNLNLLLEKMHGSRHGPSSATATDSLGHEKIRTDPLGVPVQSEKGVVATEPTQLNATSVPQQDKMDSGEVKLHSANDTPAVNDIFQKHMSRITTLMNSAFADMWQEIRNTDVIQGGKEGPSSAIQRAEHLVEIKTMREEVARLKWVQSSVATEMKRTGKMALAEFKQNVEAEKLKLVEDMRKKFEEDKIKAIAETKSKQWCANCGKEAVFYCCWNTSYCDYPCQQAHWPKHQTTCAQIRQQQTSSQNHQHNSTPITQAPNQMVNHRNSPSQHSSAQAITTAANAVYQQLPQGVVPVYAAAGVPPQGYILKSTGGAGLALLQHRPTGNGQPRKF